MDGVIPRVVVGPSGVGVLPNYVCDARLLTFRAPYPVNPGDGFLVGHVFAVATTAALAAGNTVEGMIVGVFFLPKVAGQAWASNGIPVYWDVVNRRVTTLKREPPVDHMFVGYGLNLALAADPTGIVVIGTAGTDERFTFAAPLPGP